MRILLIDSAKLKFAPYINFYASCIDRQKHEVHLLYWNRDLQQEDTEKYKGINLHEFRCYQEDDVPKYKKVKAFIKYRRYVKSVIEKEKIDRIIVFSPAVMLADILLSKFKNRFIYDYRDSSYEWFWPFKYVLGRIVAASYATFVSSEGFLCFFPKSQREKLIISHNVQLDALNHCNEGKTREKSPDKIRIAYWGLIREEEINRRIIDRLGNDERFELHYYGREQGTAQKLKQYIQKICADNVFFHGEYRPEERYEFVRNTDVIHNVFESPNMMLAMSNRFYDGLFFQIPQLCMKDSFMAKRVTTASVGFACDPYSEKFADEVAHYYKMLNKEDFDCKCDLELSGILEEFYKGQRVITHFCDGALK